MYILNALVVLCAVLLNVQIVNILSGSAEREYYVYSYPMLEKKGVIKMSPTPWGESKGWPHGRGWPALAEMPEGCPYRYLMLTMDRINYPGIPDPNWTYGAIFIYGANL